MYCNHFVFVSILTFHRTEFPGLSAVVFHDRLQPHKFDGPPFSIFFSSVDAIQEFGYKAGEMCWIRCGHIALQLYGKKKMLIRVKEKYEYLNNDVLKQRAFLWFTMDTYTVLEYGAQYIAPQILLKYSYLLAILLSFLELQFRTPEELRIEIALLNLCNRLCQSLLNGYSKLFV